MCAVQNCPLAFRETLALRQIVNELTEGSVENALNLSLDAGRLLYDVCLAIGLDPWAVLNPAIMTRLLNEDVVRLWPTTARDPGDELAETDAIREGITSNKIHQIEDPVTGMAIWRY
jgi:hypothetical protein